MVLQVGTKRQLVPSAGRSELLFRPGRTRHHPGYASSLHLKVVTQKHKFLRVNVMGILHDKFSWN